MALFVLFSFATGSGAIETNAMLAGGYAVRNSPTLLYQLALASLGTCVLAAVLSRKVGGMTDCATVIQFPIEYG